MDNKRNLEDQLSEIDSVKSDEPNDNDYSKTNLTIADLQRQLDQKKMSDTEKEHVHEECEEEEMCEECNNTVFTEIEKP